MNYVHFADRKKRTTLKLLIDLVSANKAQEKQLTHRILKAREAII